MNVDELLTLARQYWSQQMAALLLCTVPLTLCLILAGLLWWLVGHNMYDRRITEMRQLRQRGMCGRYMDERDAALLRAAELEMRLVELEARLSQLEKIEGDTEQQKGGHPCAT